MGIVDLIRIFDWTPLWISLKTGVVTTIICFFLGLWTARQVIKLNHRSRAIIDGILTLPMVLAPTVAGFILLMVFSLKRPLGSWLYGEFNIKIVQTWAGCVIAAAVISFPLMYRNARAAFEQVDINLVHAARTLGMSETKIFWKVVMPSAGPGVGSGAVLTFARALGEYGATSMLAGNIAGKTATISQQIAYVIKDGDYMKAGIWCLIMLAIAFVIMVAVNLIANKRMKHIRRW